MYYEEKMIRGQLCWRGTPNGKWRVYTKYQITQRYLEAVKRMDELSAMLAQSEAAESNYRAEMKANGIL